MVNAHFMRPHRRYRATMRQLLVIVTFHALCIPAKAWTLPPIRDIRSATPRKFAHHHNRHWLQFRYLSQESAIPSQKSLSILYAKSKDKSSGSKKKPDESKKEPSSTPTGKTAKARLQGIFQQSSSDSQKGKDSNASLSPKNSVSKSPEKEKKSKADKKVVLSEDVAKRDLKNIKGAFQSSTNVPSDEASKDKEGFSFRSMLFNRTSEDSVEKMVQPVKNETGFLRGMWRRGRNIKPDASVEVSVRKGKRNKASQSDASKQLNKKQQQASKQKQQLEVPEDTGPGLFSKIQGAASEFFNTSSSSPNTTTANSPNETSSRGGPISVAQKFLSSTFSSWSSGDNVKEEWVTVFPKTRLMPGVIVPITVAGGLDLLVVASKDGRSLYAIENSCPHLGTPLETGQLVRLPVETTSEAVNEDSASSSQFQKLSGAFNGPWSETDVASILQQDGCEDCIVCPLHRTAFALQSGAVRGEWCPYPPVLGKIMGNIKPPTGVAVFDVRTRGKNVEIRINTPLIIGEDDADNAKRKE